MDARDARWFESPGRGDSVPLTGGRQIEAETYFPMMGMSIRVMQPGEPNSTYHWETEQEDFLVLSGRGAPDRRRRGAAAPAVGLRALPAAHAPRLRRRREGPCVILASVLATVPEGRAVGLLLPPTRPPPGTTRRLAEDTQDGEVAYARFPADRETRYPGGLLPGDWAASSDLDA